MAGQNPQDAQITVYWLDKSRAQRIIWLLEELNLNYEVKVFWRDSGMLAPKELRDIHPLGKSPIIGIKTPKMEKELVIAESGAIVEYLIEHFGTHMIPKRYPTGQEGHIDAETPEYLRNRYLMHYAEGTLMAVLVVGLIISSIKNAPVPFFIKPITGMIASKVEKGYIEPNTDANFAFCEQQLATSPNGGQWFCGSELTGADILLSFPLELNVEIGAITKEKYPNMVSFVERLRAREAYKRGIARMEEVTGKPVVTTVRTGKSQL